MMRTWPSEPAFPVTDIIGVGLSTSFRLPTMLALSAPVAWICRLALSELTCWVCCAASCRAWDVRDDDEAVPNCEPDAPLKLPGLHPATVTAAATATAAKPSGRTALAGTPKRVARAGRAGVVPSGGTPARRAFNCGNTLAPPWVGDCRTSHVF